jgi:acetyl esterase
MWPEVELDPEIRRFVSEVSASYASYPRLEKVDYPRARAIAEEVRAPWRSGGPRMRSITEHQVPVAGDSIRIRVYDPGLDGDRPALIYLHGGGWTIFSLDTHDRVMREYASRGSFAVIGVDYPLSPEAKFPRALNQITDLVLWLIRIGPSIGIDGRRLAIGGDSAGGNLTVSACLKLRDAGFARAVSGMLVNYGGFDIECSKESEERFGGPGFMLTRDEVTMFWGNYLSGPEDAANPLACPLHADLRELPPAFFAIPECDILSEQSYKMLERLKQSGVEAEWQIYAGATHSFLEAVSISAIAARALEDGARWTKRVLNV